MADNAALTQQHSHGGVARLDWNEESFRRAQALHRPILLDISAVWCHWCHVMDQTSYSDPDVIELIERYYVPIRVDNDRRPDINERYNMGGWPTTAILTPHGDVLTGGTYIPTEQMRVTLARVADYYRRNKQEIAAKLASQPLARPQPAAAHAAALAATTVDRVLAAVRDSFDPAYGGFGDAPKFPHTDAVDLALRDDQRHSNQASLNVATLIDAATLTGACVIALGHVYTGAFTNNQPALDKLLAVSKESGEKIRPMPTDDEYKEQLESDVADMKNTGGRPAGAITGALFIGASAEDTPWIHLNIAGSSQLGGGKELPYQPKFAAGVMTRTLALLAERMA